MHVLKNSLDSILRHISGKQKDTLDLRRDIALSHTKLVRRRLWPNRENKTYLEAPCIFEEERYSPTKKIHPFNKETYWL